MKGAIALILFITSLTVLPVSAQENQSSPELGFGMTIGTVTLDEKVYNSVRLLPELVLGKLGVGLDIDFRFTLENNDSGDTEFNVYSDDWYISEDATFQKYMNLYLSKFAYIRWGEERDPLFLRFGSLGSTTLGTGFIMGGYSNTLFLPEQRIFGGQFNITGELIDFPYGGVQGMVSNLSELDLFGGRLYAYPAAGTEIPIVKSVEVGTSFYIDRDPFLYLSDEDDNGYFDIYENSFYATGYDTDNIVITGLDAIAPLYQNDFSSMALMGDVVFQGNGDPKTGGMIGLGGSVLFFRYMGQIRFMGDDFQPVFFDRSYDLIRAERYLIYSNEGDPILEASTGYLASLGTSFMQDSLIFNVSVEGPFSNPENDPNKYPHMKGVFVLAPGVIELVDFNFWYDKRYINSFEDLVSPENAIIGGLVNFHMSPAVITFQMDVKYDPNDPDQWRVTSQIRTGIQF